MIYFKILVVNEYGSEVDRYILAARGEKEATQLAKVTFRHFHPDKEILSHDFHTDLNRYSTVSNLYCIDANPPAYDAQDRLGETHDY